MNGQIIARKRLVNSLLLQYQLLFLCILRKEHHHFGKKREKDFGCENYLKIERKKPFFNTSERLTTSRPIIFLKKLSNGHKII